MPKNLPAPMFRRIAKKTPGQLEIALPGMKLSVYADSVALDTGAGVIKYQFARDNIVTAELVLSTADGTWRQVHNKIMAWKDS